MNKTMLYVIWGCSASLGLVGWRVHAMKNQVTVDFTILEDFSLSHAQGCKSLAALTERVLNSESVSQKSTITVLVVGDQKTGNEPWQLGRYSIPRDERVLEGRAARVRRQQELLNDLNKKCEATRPATISPIFLGVKQAVADLRAQGCIGNSRCALFVDTDLEENVEPTIRNGLKAIDKVYIPLPPIDNAGIEVTFCGLAVRTGRIVDPLGRETGKIFLNARDSDDHLEQVWLGLFAKPESIRFEPYCRQQF